MGLLEQLHTNAAMRNAVKDIAGGAGNYLQAGAVAEKKKKELRAQIDTNDLLAKLGAAPPDWRKKRAELMMMAYPEQSRPWGLVQEGIGNATGMYDRPEAFRSSPTMVTEEPY